jgi:hypothetical protein
LIYAASTDFILDVLEKSEKFAKYHFELVAYADDILLGIDDDANVEEIISEV